METTPVNTSQSPAQIAAEYKKIIGAFKKRFDVQNGRALGYSRGGKPPRFEDTPKGIGDGLGTTGWCVSASNALYTDNSFQMFLRERSAIAKLVSIDIKEQYYGYCYNGTQNKWHTAILVQDSGMNFIVDITCRQFGNNFVNKEFWDFNTWQKTFRSPLCQHKITDFIGNPLSVAPAPKSFVNPDMSVMEYINILKNVTTINDNERRIVAEFFVNKLEALNQRMIIGNLGQADYQYITELNKIFEHFPFQINQKPYYSVLQFDTKDAAKNWIKLLAENKWIMPNYLVVSKTLQDNCQFNVVDYFSLNTDVTAFSEGVTYVVLEFINISGIGISDLPNVDILLPYGTKLNVDVNSIQNGGYRNAAASDGANPQKVLNTIYMTIK